MKSSFASLFVVIASCLALVGATPVNGPSDACDVTDGTSTNFGGSELLQPQGTGNVVNYPGDKNFTAYFDKTSTPAIKVVNGDNVDIEIAIYYNDGDALNPDVSFYVVKNSKTCTVDALKDGKKFDDIKYVRIHRAYPPGGVPEEDDDDE
jgi:hypothetical protein